MNNIFSIIFIIGIIFLIYTFTKEIKYYFLKKEYFKQQKIKHYYKYLEINNKSKENTENKENNKSKYNYQYQYRKKDYILTKTELIFYKKLLILTSKYNYMLLTQIPLYSIIETKNTIYKQTAFNKIKSKSIDFVIATNKLKPILCIELDDYTHNYKKRIERDIFINNLFNDINIKLLRIKVQRNYNIEEIENYLNNISKPCNQ